MAAELVAYGTRISLGDKAGWCGYVVPSGLVYGAVQILGKIEGMMVTVKSGDSDTSFTVAMNQMSGGTAADGYFYINSAIDGDYYHVFAVGTP
jgi:hypothetical protein